MNLKQYYLGVGLLLVGCSQDEIIDIEASNEYTWQKYMNEEEFEQLESGMTYLEVVRVVGGEGEKISEKKYEWPDEQLMTQAYELEFINDELIEKKIIEKKGHSTR